jgi:hypothetical protein
MKNQALRFITVAATFHLLACGGVIPSAYRGQFVDGPSGARLELQKEAGILTFADGRQVNASAQELTFEDLKTLKAGIYMDLKSKSVPKNHAEVYWISPTENPRDVGAGLVHVKAEVAITTMRIDAENPVPSLSLVHCLQGGVLLDTAKNRWQAGCGTETTTYFDFKRIESQ